MQGGKINERDKFYLEQLFIGELKQESKLEHIPEIVRQNMREEFRAEAEELFDRIPPRQFAEQLLEREKNNQLEQRQLHSELSLNRAARSWRRSDDTGVHWPLTRVLPIAAAAVFAVLVGILATYPSLQPGSDAPVERIKGMEPALNIYRAEGEQARLLEDRDRAREYDLLQLEYNAAGYPYGVILSIDGRGTVTLHYPTAATRPPELNSGSVLLPYSYQLDDAPEFERFFFLVSQKEFSLQRVLESAEEMAAGRNHGRSGTLELPADIKQYSIMILKEDK